MKTAFWGQPDMLRKVYPEETISKIGLAAGEPASFVEDYSPTDAEVIFTTWGMKSFRHEEIREVFPNLKYIFYAAGSVQSFARPFLARGVRIFSAWQANAVPVAEFTASQILLAGKRYFDIFTGGNASAKGNYNLKVGIIGMGSVGWRTASLLKRHHVNVLAYDKFMPADIMVEYRASKASLQDIFRECDVISNHLADNPQTRGVISRKLLESMKDDACFINTGRGAQVDHDALYDVMKASPNRTCLLDVTYPEPLPEDHPLRTLKNVIISPHIAGSLGNELRRMSDYMLKEFFSVVVKGEEPTFEVTKYMLEVMA
ncbi:MAG: hydroxyacid dehydrogenase [Clostridia bacterium]|nr:hydroxyacid dehydrogenase [Clostridia bacterium]